MESLIVTIDRKYGNWIFYAALVSMLLSAYWVWSRDLPISVRMISVHLLTLSKYLCCIRIGLLSWKYPRYVLLCALIIPLFYVSSRLCQSPILLKTALIVTASRDSDIRIILKIYLTIFLIVLFAAPISSALGWTGDIVKHKLGMVGHSWGFYNPNRYAFFLQMLLFLVILFFKVEKTRYVVLFSWFFAALLGWLTLSATSVIVLLVFPILYYWFKNSPRTAMAFAFVPMLLTILSISLSIYFGPTTGESTFESRFGIPYLLVERHGISLLGRDCGTVTMIDSIRKGIEPLYMNCFYLDLIVKRGVIIALIVLAFYSHYLYRLGRMQSPLLGAMVICLAFTGLMQLHVSNIKFDFLLLYYFKHSVVHEKGTMVNNE